jgi:hypothetical protein
MIRASRDTPTNDAVSATTSQQATADEMIE